MHDEDIVCPDCGRPYLMLSRGRNRTVIVTHKYSCGLTDERDKEQREKLRQLFSKD